MPDTKLYLLLTGTGLQGLPCEQSVVGYHVCNSPHGLAGEQHATLWQSRLGLLAAHVLTQQATSEPGLADGKQLCSVSLIDTRETPEAVCSAQRFHAN